MKRRSKVIGKPAKARRFGASQPKHGLKPDKAFRSTADDEAGEIVRLNRELREALERQAATSQVLQVISSSAGELHGVFQTILANATRICEAKFGVMQLLEGGGLRAAAFHDVPSAYAEAMRRDPVFHPKVGHPLRRVMETKQVVHAPDARTEQNMRGRIVELAGARTLLLVPMLKDKELIGITCIYRQEVRPFTDKQIELVKNFAAQAVIAVENARLLNELRQRTTDLTEALEQQTATSDVLGVISSSPGDLEPVFQTILQNATRICEAKFGTLYFREGDTFRTVTMHGAPPEYAEFHRRRGPFQPPPGSQLDKVTRTKQSSQSADYDAEATPGSAARLAGARSRICVPMLKGYVLIGAIAIYRQEVRPFTDRQIELVQNFAAQAVIAIENARLLNELRQSLEQQTATSEVLQVISSSPGALQPVFDAMLTNATRLCEASFGILLRYENAAFHVAASHNAPPAFVELRRREPTIRASGVLRRVVARKQLLHISDCLDDASYKQGDADFVRFVDLCGARSFIAAPMLKDDELVGTITVFHQEVRPFTDKQIALVTNFAAQAVIAIENARLLSELRQSLEQQTATSEVLQVISASPGELEPVFTTMLEKAVRICDAKYGSLYLHEDGKLRLVAAHDVPEFLEARRGVAFEPAPGGGLDEAMRTKRAIQIPDLAATKPYLERHPGVVEAVELAGIRTGMTVPMLKDDQVIGVIAIHRREVLAFTGKQVELLTNFAAQAVIAIENARLLNELRQRTTDLTEALEQQTATSEVLQVISSSPGDLQPVFASMLENAVRICDATFGNIYRWDGEALHLLAAENTPPAFAEARKRLPRHPSPNTPAGRTIATRTAVHVADLAAEQAYGEHHDPATVEAVELGGVRTFISVPLLKENELIGTFSLARQEIRPFSDKQIALVTNFAAQAVIAIENARLLNELRQRTGDLTDALEQQTGTSELLQVISSSSGDLEPVFATMLENAVSICDATFGNIYRVEGDGLRIVATHHTPAVFAEARRTTPYFSPGPKNPVRRMMTTKSVVHVDDVAATEAYADREPAAVASVELGGTRTLMIVPMLKENELVGACMLARQEVRPFNNKQMELVTNFAAQAVIAIENARLLNELRQRTTDLTERTADLTEALEQQTATSEVLQAISGSPGDLQPVFATMLENMVRVCHASFGAVHRCQGDVFQFVAEHSSPPAYANLIKHSPFRPGPRHYFGPMIASKSVEQFADLAASQGYLDRRPEFVSAVELGGVRTGLNVPMLKENELIGVFALARKEVHPFTGKQIELVENFAAQAVIAIENSRLLNELRQALEQQTATSEVLKVISTTRGELEPAFHVMLEKATHLCDASFGNLLLMEGEDARVAAMHNAPSAFSELRRRTPVFRPPEWTRDPTKAYLHISDCAEAPAYKQRDTGAVAMVELAQARTLLNVPMTKDGQLMGYFALYRQEVRPFTDKQIELVQNFAAQAVIAIENARLLRELRERTDQSEAQSQELANLNQQLEQRVTDQVGEIERMSRLRRFLPPQVADLIVASGSEKQLESHRREITALFCDLRGFTGFTESADAEDVMALLRDYHAAIGELVIRYSGTLERYAGDGVMVIFNDPVPVENPALQAVLMALELRNALRALTHTWSRLGHEIGFGIGVAHGFATLGTIGYEGRFDYAAIGTVSNVASRLCDEAKPGQILVSARVLTKVEDAVKVEPVGEFELKGIRRPLAAYNVVAAAT